MGRFSSRAILPILLVLALSLAPRASAQFPTLIPFGEVPCDSTACVEITWWERAPEWAIERIDFRDSTRFVLESGPQLPFVGGGDTARLRFCFTGDRRGVRHDSVTVLLRSVTGIDTVRMRLTGTVVGPVITAIPSVLNFPLTTTTTTSTRSLRLVNSGERPVTITPADVPINPPFRLVTPLPLTIDPGDTVLFEFEFAPVEQSIYSEQIDLPVGCSTRLRLELNGATELTGTGAVLRVSKTGFNPSNEEEVLCGTVRCTDVILSNVGNALLRIDSAQFVRLTEGFVIAAPPTFPFTILPGRDTLLRVCMNTPRRGMLRDTMLIGSNSRSSIAFGLVIDVSRSMAMRMFCGGSLTPRIDQAQIAARDFVNRALLDLPAVGVRDQFALSSFTTASPSPSAPSVITTHVPLSWVNQSVRQSAVNAIQGLRTVGGTPTGEALKMMIDTLAQSPLSNRVIILVTDGEPSPDDDRDFPATSSIAAARAAGVRIFPIGIGMSVNGQAYLAQLASGTDGVSFNGNNCDELGSAFETITALLSEGATNLEPFAIRVTAPQLVGDTLLLFDSTLIGVTVCRELNLANVGEGNALLDEPALRTLLGAPSPEFVIRTSRPFPLEVREGDQTTITVCFTPDSIRGRSARGTATYNSCDADSLRVRLAGVGYAFARMRVNDQRVGLPGSLVTMPVHLDSILTDYGVGTIRWSVSWKSSMLDLRGVTAGAANPGAAVSLAGPVRFANGRATADLVASGLPFDGGGELAQLEFQVLRGDTLASTVEISSVTFEDGNPHPLITNAGLIAFDSTCFRDYKPIRSAATAKLVVGDPTPSPSRDGEARLTIETDQPGDLEIVIYNAAGRRAAPSTRHELPVGGSDLPIQLGELPPGAYHLYIALNGQVRATRRIVVIR